ncbi:MAG TPA: di-heme-cytochrome C peroxidase [Terriglobales bacterium]|jgi:mono/diheme cytochrome c family protein
MKRITQWALRILYGAGALVLLALVAYCAVFMYIERQGASAPAIDQTRYLDQGWGTAPNAPDREAYSFTPQGVALRNIPYDWLLHLERPWSTDRFAAAKYMRAYGFIAVPDNDRIAVGLTWHWDAATGQRMTDMTCALCHTGELDIMHNGARTAVRIDGGPAMHDLTSTRLGRFPTDLLASLTATYFDPFKFRRFSAAVLGSGNNSVARGQLHHQLWQVVTALFSQAGIDQSKHLYPVEEGFGRTDALGRIANTVFATHLDPRNYHVANAPVSYPPLWDIWKFDWVQYTSSVRQPMARNIGESLGTGATIDLLDAYGRPVPASERYLVSTIVPNLRVIETTLRKLRPPCWPEDLFGPIDVPLAQEGAVIFHAVCETCHGPHLASPLQKAFDAPGKSANDPDWIMHTLAADDIGTDPQAALNFMRHRFDLTRSGLTADAIRAQLAQTWSPNYDRQLAFDAATLRASLPASPEYRRAQADQAKLQTEGREAYIAQKIGTLDLTSVSTAAGLTDLIAFIRPRVYADLGLTPAQQAEWNGFDQLDTPQEGIHYKARPLAGVWATAPYLHNGSVPNLYELLSPVYERDKVFYLGDRDFDPVRVGLVTNSGGKGSFRYDTSIPGNFNTGHEFRAGYRPWTPGSPPAHGVIGPEFTPHQRMAIIEYLKVHRDDPNDHSCSVYVP